MRPSFRNSLCWARTSSAPTAASSRRRSRFGSSRENPGGNSGGAGRFLDHGVLIEIENGQFPIIQSQLQAIEPKLVILGVGEPRTSLGLLKTRHNALDGLGPHAVDLSDLLRDANALAGLIESGLQRHGR